jgi:hypothetical protein
VSLAGFDGASAARATSAATGTTAGSAYSPELDWTTCGSDQCARFAALAPH